MRVKDYLAAMTPEQRKALLTRGVPLVVQRPPPKPPHLVLRAGMNVLWKEISPRRVWRPSRPGNSRPSFATGSESLRD